MEKLKLGKRIRDLREDKKLKQAELGELLGFSQSRLANYENGISEPTIEIIMKMAEYFNVTVDYLLGRENKEFILSEPRTEFPSKEYLEELNKLKKTKVELIEPGFEGLMTLYTKKVEENAILKYQLEECRKQNGNLKTEHSILL